MDMASNVRVVNLNAEGQLNKDGVKPVDMASNVNVRVVDLDEQGQTHDEEVKPRLFGEDFLKRQRSRRPLTFNIMCIGEPGIGKSTLMDTLFNTSFEYKSRIHDLLCDQLQANTYELREKNMRMKLTIVETVGFGDQLDDSDTIDSIVDYIEAQLEAYLREDLNIPRRIHLYTDTRIHTCLYFISPIGYSLKPLDLATMKALDSKVNLIPIIAKADTLKKEELQKFKEEVRSELQCNGVNIYQFPTDDDNDDEPEADRTNNINELIPFAVLGSCDDVEVGDKIVKGRQYPWGTVEVDNSDHCDTIKLRQMLLRHNMDDMREITHKESYELYRRNRLVQMGLKDDDDLTLPETYKKRVVEHLKEFQKREDIWKEKKKTFSIKLLKKDQELEETKKELQNRQEWLDQWEAEEKRWIEERKKQLDQEIQLLQRKKQEAQKAAQACFGVMKGAKK